jgi:multiple sugar transport system permease protein
MALAASEPGTRSGSADAGRMALLLFAVLVAIAFLFPLVWAAVASLKPVSEAVASPPTFLPSRLTLENYAKLDEYGRGLGHHALNSVIVSALCALMTMPIATLAGYGFSRFRFPGRSLVFLLTLSALMIPFQSILIPTFLVLNALDLTSSLVGLAIVYTTFQLPFACFLMRNSFDTVPRDLEDAGLTDGCGSLSVLLRVMVPIVRPGIITVGLFAFLAAWNELLAAVVLLNDVKSFTLPILLVSVQSGHLNTLDWGALQAGATVAVVPVILLFLILQRYYVSGLISGAVKA